MFAAIHRASSRVSRWAAERLTSSLDHIVGKRKQLVRDVHAKRLGSLTLSR
jgi:hypothetical protein